MTSISSTTLARADIPAPIHLRHVISNTSLEGAIDSTSRSALRPPYAVAPLQKILRSWIGEPYKVRLEIGALARPEANQRRRAWTSCRIGGIVKCSEFDSHDECNTESDANVRSRTLSSSSERLWKTFSAFFLTRQQLDRPRRTYLCYRLL